MNPEHNQKHEHLAERVLERIAGEHLVPRPRWEFLFKNYTFWTLGALSVALGALAFSAVLFEVQNVDWRLSSATHADFFSFFLSAAPFFWVVTLTLFILIGYINVRFTNRGYRYPLVVIAIGAVLTSLALGSGIYLTGFGGAIDDIGGHVPFYRSILAEQHAWWLAPEKGLLVGQVISTAPALDSFTLRDSTGHEWQIDSDDLRNRDLTLVARGGEVRIVGVPLSATSSVFHSCFVFPVETQGIFKKGSPPPPLAAVASTRGRRTERSDECKGIRPYTDLRAIEDDF